MRLNKGFTVITGETGAGKSILLGALSLLLGQRADSSVLQNSDKKCTVEAHFKIDAYNLQSYFEKHDLDYDDLTIIRREITPAGRSRAFINDTPVNLNTLKNLTLQLVDIHSQHKNLELNNPFFQLNTLDAFAGLSAQVGQVKTAYQNYIAVKNELDALNKQAEELIAEQDYMQFLFDELYELQLIEDEEDTLKNEVDLLNNAEEIKQRLSESCEILSGETTGVLDNLISIENNLNRIQNYWKKSNELQTRITGARIELEDIYAELQNDAEAIDYNPKRAEELNERLNKIYHLQKKHKVNSVAELIDIQKDLENKLQNINSFDERIAALKEKLDTQKTELQNKSEKLSEKRKKASPKFEKKIRELLIQLSMPAAIFKIEINKTENFTPHGTDKINFLFSANKNTPAQNIGKVASGGEISRLMLSLKSVIAASVALPSIIFDEIDTGISGDVADKTAKIMKSMSENMQVIDITHLPQVAAKADYHFFVYKKDTGKTSESNIKQLSDNERIEALAAMLSGEKITDAAVLQAKELLKSGK